MIKKFISAAMAAVMAISCFVNISDTVTTAEESAINIKQGESCDFTLHYNQTINFTYTVETAEPIYLRIACENNAHNWNTIVYLDGEVLKESLGMIHPSLWVLPNSEENIGKEMTFSFNSLNVGWSESETHDISFCVLNYEEVSLSPLPDRYAMNIPQNTAKKVCFTIDKKAQWKISTYDCKADLVEGNAFISMSYDFQNVDTNERYGFGSDYFQVLEPGNYSFLVRSIRDIGNMSLILTAYEARPEQLAGDSEKLDLYDAIEIAKYLIGTVKFDNYNMARADYDLNNEVNLYDVIGIAKALLR